MIVHKNMIKDAGRVLFWYPLRWMVERISLRAVYSLGTLVGAVDYYASGKKGVSRMKTNLTDTFGVSGTQVDRIVMESLQNHSRNVLEMIKYPQMTAGNTSGIIRFDGLAHLDRALENKKGVVLVTGHFGAKQVLQLGLGLAGYSLTQINYHMKENELTWVQKNVSQRQRIRIEQAMPVRFVSANAFLGSAVKSLKKNKILLIGGDGIGVKKYMGKGYKRFEFLGRQMRFPTGAVALAKWTGAAMLPVFDLRDRFRHTIVIERPIDPKLSHDDMLRHYIRYLERYVRRDPPLWEFWEEFDRDTLIDSEG